MKPLTKEDLGWVHRLEKQMGFWDCSCVDDNPEPCLRCRVERLLAAEAYWSEAVKNLPLVGRFVPKGSGKEHCPKCGSTAFPFKPPRGFLCDASWKIATEHEGGHFEGREWTIEDWKERHEEDVWLRRNGRQSMVTTAMLFEDQP